MNSVLDGFRTIRYTNSLTYLLTTLIPNIFASDGKWRPAAIVSQRRKLSVGANGSRDVRASVRAVQLMQPHDVQLVVRHTVQNNAAIHGSVTITTYKVVQTVQQHVSYKFISTRSTYDYI